MPDLEWVRLLRPDIVLRLRVANNQGVATDSPHVQLVQLPHSPIFAGYTPLEVPLRTLFVDLSAGAQAPSWYEGYDGVYHYWWVRTGSIPANSYIDLLLLFRSTATVLDGSKAGLNYHYAALNGLPTNLDNGANVFLFYNNGTSLLPGQYISAGSISVASFAGVSGMFPSAIKLVNTYSTPGADAATWVTNYISPTTTPSLNLPSRFIAQSYVYLGASAGLLDLLTNLTGYRGQFYMFRLDMRSGYYNNISYYPAGATGSATLCSTTTTSSARRWYLLTGVNNNDNLTIYWNSGAIGAYPAPFLGSLGTVGCTAAGKGYTGGGVGITTDGYQETVYCAMIVVRDYPPNGVMPVVTLVG